MPVCRIVDDVTPRAKRHCTVDREPSLVHRHPVVLPCCLACLPCLLRHSCLTVQALALCDAPQVVVDVTGCGPNAAVQLLRQSLPSDVEGRRVWCQRAKIAAIIGSCPKSRDSFRSGSCVVYTSSAGPPIFVVGQVYATGSALQKSRSVVHTALSLLHLRASSLGATSSDALAHLLIMWGTCVVHVSLLMWTCHQRITRPFNVPRPR